MERFRKTPPIGLEKIKPAIPDSSTHAYGVGAHRASANAIYVKQLPDSQWPPYKRVFALGGVLARLSLRACDEAISASDQDYIIEIAALHYVALAMTDELVHTTMLAYAILLLCNTVNIWRTILKYTLCELLLL